MKPLDRSLSRCELLQLEGRTLAGGSQSRERLSRLLGVTALSRLGFQLTAAGWIVDHLEVQIESPEGDPALLIVDRLGKGQPGMITCGELNIGYRGGELDPRLEAAIRRVASRSFAGASLEDLAALILTDPESGGRAQPLPAAPVGEQQRFADGSLLSSWAGPGVWRQFFAVAEIARAQLDSLDTFNRSLFVQHCEAECLAIAPQTGVDMVPKALYPWDDRIRRIDWTTAGPRHVPDPHRLITTDLDEQDVILGRGPAKLDAALDTLKRRDLSTSSMIFCSSTCLPVVAGEDVETVVRRHERHLPLPLMHLTTTPHSMQSLLSGLLVTRRLEAEESSPPRRGHPSINLVGFSEDPGLEELRGALGGLGIEVNVVILPALGPELIDAYPQGHLSVLYPNELWQGHYSQLQIGSRIRSIAPPPPFGPSGIGTWLTAIAGELEIDIDVGSVFEDRWRELDEEWATLIERSQSHTLGFVVTDREIDFLKDPRKSWGVPLIPLIIEMGFQVQVLLGSSEGDSSRALDMVRSISDNALTITTFHDRSELSRLLASSGLSAVFSEHFFDRRLSESGLSTFSLQHFEQGFSGALRTLHRLVEVCELTFYRRYGGIIAKSTSRNRGQVNPFGIDGLHSSQVLRRSQ